jgi:hypothetical protein
MHVCGTAILQWYLTYLQDRMHTLQKKHMMGPSESMGSFAVPGCSCGGHMDV